MPVMQPCAIIIGAGIAGPVLAIQLQGTGYEVKIFEAKPGADTKGGAFLAARYRHWL